ncbi:metal ABC transporter permease [Companilactobacillus sp.]|jgi:zinc/manganese transport system permease protein|uniref:metal ABC transporter permease n=1 Tax=Companilactobacillus sp. TaxID=2767905 RepID=UPI0025BDA2AE|nr:metal ABC transporter permease [Companilactobacillus sp.]MCH4009319.1 metal ABC transporter permease [Companilactobacillus sp.]MCH4050502.1 metal ABC transporter permease [Companilactobacillus sp.]MCH4077261.1 metal ABC transporter permease [Companilactobacillus sp.]MCH4125837.1 metal ABC transporter permease [Companilactobacillus sp.]MCI1311546.1 metal ABC transporter permease [Companilactobacillus sp.]
MFGYEFMREAFIASTFIAITAGIVGVFVVSRNMSFLSHTLSEIGFAGAAFGILVGISPLAGMIIFTLVSSIAVGSLSTESSRREASISAISSLFIGLGILFLSLSSESSSYATNILFGSIVGISSKEVNQLLILALFVIVVFIICYKPLAFDSFDHIGARASGLNTRFLSVVFLITLALSVSIGAQIVGSLLVFVLLTLPGATARYLVHSVPKLLMISVGLSLAGVWLGLYLAFVTNWPVTFFISAFEVIAYFLGLSYKNWKLSH